MDDPEARIDLMIADGKRIMAEAIATYKPVAIVAAFSSGDDSIVSTHFAMTNYSDAFVFNADTLIGLAPSRCHLRNVCAKSKWQLEVGDAYAEGPPKRMRENGKLVPFDAAILPSGKWVDGATAYEELCLNHGFPGPGMHARAYQRLKERPITRMLRRLGASGAASKPKVLLVSGIRHDESSRRAGYKRAHAAGRYGDVWVNPFYYHTAADFELYREEFGLPRNPVKRQCGISGECCCGAFGDAIVERQAYRAVDPEMADRLDTLEARVRSNGYPWGWAERQPSWFARKRQDERSGQCVLFDLYPPEFQPMCVGCNSGRR